jgi:acyl-[acyl-carrier-protein]-phospholipid O-acyltransferase/long-chain-fatty-acid--[acyl-carrier-protein] ligase
MRWFFKSDYRSFYFLNATQFLGALNDNLFKLLVVYMLINVQGSAAAAKILSLAGAIFVIPFLLFSSGAGVVADRKSKRSIIVFTKILEVAIMLFGLFAVSFHSAWASYTALFFMATQSAIFGPSKYGIIPELVEEKRVSKANGSMTSFTYLAIILGTFLASFLTDISNKNFFFVACCCVIIAIVGLVMSLGIARTKAQRSTKKINPIFIYEIYQTLKFSWGVPHLVPAIFGSAFFLFIGAYTQLNIIPFAIQSLGLSEVGGGYLFLSTAVGIAVGAVFAGQLSKDRVEPGISCICGFFIGILFLMIFIFSNHLWPIIFLLFLLGFFGGAFLIPFDSFIQVNSPDEKRGQVIAASNFFSFIGVLLASLVLYTFSEELGLTSASGFALMGMLSLITSVLLSGRLSDLLLSFFARKILKRFRVVKLESALPTPGTLLVWQSDTWWDILLLFSIFPKLRILLPTDPFHAFAWINGWIESICFAPTRESLEETYRANGNAVYCLFLHKKDDLPKILSLYEPFLKEHGIKVLYAHGKKERIPKRFFLSYTHKQIALHFTGSP